MLKPWTLVSGTRVSFAIIAAVPVRVELVDIVADLLVGVSSYLGTVTAVLSSFACKGVAAIVGAAVCKPLFDQRGPSVDADCREEGGEGGE